MGAVTAVDVTEGRDDGVDDEGDELVRAAATAATFASVLNIRPR